MKKDRSTKSKIDYEREFDKYTFNNGLYGRFDLEMLDTENYLVFDAYTYQVQEMIDVIRNAPQGNVPNRLPHIHFDYLNSSACNASAIMNPDTGDYYIGLNYGTFLLLVDLFNRMLARKDILPEIGSIELEENPPPIKLALDYATIQQTMPEHLKYTSSVLPIDPIRQEHAALLATFAINFLIYHEIGHLRNGHVACKRNLGGLSFIMEFDPGDTFKFPPLTNKVLEWDADCFAASWSINQLINAIEKPANVFGNSFDKYDTIAHGLFFNWGFAIWAMFRLFDTVRTVPGRPAPPHYPTARQRQFSIISLAEHLLDNYGDKFKAEVIIDNLRKIIFQGEKALALISDFHPVIDQSKSTMKAHLDLYGDNIIIFLDEFNEQWKNVARPMLLPFAHTSDLPL